MSMSILLILLIGAGFAMVLVVFVIGVVMHYSKVEKQISSEKEIKRINGQGDTEGILKEAKEKIKSINNQCYRLKDMTLVEEIKTVTERASEILKEISGDSIKIKRAKKFLNYYLDATNNIVTKYTELVSKDIESHDVVLDRVRPIISDIKKGFDLEYAKIFEDDLMDLNVEIEVLKTSIDQEIGN